MKQYDVRAATAAQIKYCDGKHLPFFAPHDGECPRCHRSIYKPRGGDGVGGIDIKAAGEQLITSCPHCGTTFCD